MTLLTRRAAVLAAIEDSYNVAQTLSASTDALLVEEPDYQADPTVLTRDFASPDLSPKAHIIGRKLARFTFTTELRGSGTQHSGSTADEARIGRLLRACGYGRTAISAAEASAVYMAGTHLNSVSFAVDDAGLSGVTHVVGYVITVTTGGASGTAEVKVESDDPAQATQTGVVVTSGEDITVGTQGLVVTPTFSGSLAVGQTWNLYAMPPGLRYDPISEDVPSLTMAMYLDGVLHKITGAYGTFSINAEAGQYAKIDWEFTGQFVAVTDAAFPSPTYETSLPAMVELARLRIDGFGAVVNAFTYDQANTIAIRPDVNNSDGYNGVRITAREPTGGIDPEATLVASHDFWGKLAAARTMPFGMRVGITPGNIVWLKAPAVQYSGLTYRDRDGLRAYDAGLGFKRYNGDDEIRFLFV